MYLSARQFLNFSFSKRQGKVHSRSVYNNKLSSCEDCSLYSKLSRVMVMRTLLRFAGYPHTRIAPKWCTIWGYPLNSSECSHENVLQFQHIDRKSTRLNS